MPLSTEETVIIKHILIDDEGLRQFPYLDCCGKEWRKCVCKEKGYLTIGVGRNLDTVGISDNEAMELEMNDIKKLTDSIERSFPWFEKLKTARRIVVLSMVFNLGLAGFKEFKKVIKNIESGNFRAAAKEMLYSKWASQVQGRATRLASIMESGQF